VPVPWEGKHFTRDFEAFALTLMREMPMKKAGEILGEHDPRLWRLLFAHVDKADAALDLSELVHLGVDGLNCRKGHNYLTVFADLVNRRVIFATEGKDHRDSNFPWASQYGIRIGKMYS
jgi:transposase